MLGALLAENPGHEREAETCFITATVEYPRWVEGIFISIQ